MSVIVVTIAYNSFRNVYTSHILTYIFTKLDIHLMYIHPSMHSKFYAHYVHNIVFTFSRKNNTITNYIIYLIPFLFV